MVRYLNATTRNKEDDVKSIQSKSSSSICSPPRKDKETAKI